MRALRPLRPNRRGPPNLLFLVFVLLNSLLFLGLTSFAIVSATRKPQPPVNDAAPALTPRHVNNAFGPSGKLTILGRHRDAIGTAVQTWGFGPGRKHHIRHTRANSPLPRVYRDTISALVADECEHAQAGCELLSNGFATVGVVRYSFSAQRENIVGSSTQVQTACRCIGTECDQAILMRPVNITQRAPDGTIQLTGRKSCIYQFFEGRFTDCHAETLRMQRHSESDVVRDGFFEFKVDASQYDQGTWQAVGHRGWDYACLKQDFDSLPTVNLSAIQGNISSDVHQYPPSREEGIPSQSSSEDCRPPPNVIYFRDSDEREGEECASAFQFAMAGASFLGSQMDEVAIGKDKRTYLNEVPTLLVFWEIMILISAASLGLYFAISAFLRFRKKGEWTWGGILKLLGVQLMSLLFEGLPLYFALSLESAASMWTGRFAYIGATVALGRDVLRPQTVAHGNILVLTAVVGESRFLATQLIAVALFTAVINLAALVIVGLVVWAFLINWKRRGVEESVGGKMEVKMEEGMEEDVEEDIKEDIKRGLRGGREATWKEWLQLKMSNQLSKF